MSSIKNIMKRILNILLIALVGLLLFAAPADAVQLNKQVYSTSNSPSALAKYSGNPVLSTDFIPHDAKGIRQAGILNVFNPDYTVSYKDNGKYYLFYDSCGGTDTDIWLPAMATSVDLISWTKQGLTNVVPTSSNYWESLDTSAVTVIKHNSTYYMYYMGAPLDSGVPSHVPNFPNCMGLATTSTIDDVNSWIKYSNVPVLDVGGSGTWENVFVLTGSILRDPTSARWMMFYAGYNGSLEQVGIAYSTDLVNWTKYSGNPIATVQHGDCPRIFKAGDGYYYMITNHTTYTYTDSLELFRNTNPELTSWESLGVILGRSDSGWDSGTIGVAAPVYENGTLSFLYDGGSNFEHMGRQIGLAQGIVVLPTTQIKLLGRDDIAILGGNGANTITMQKFIAISTGNVTEMRFRVPSNVAGNVAIGVYTDSNGSPSALLGQTIIAVSSGVGRVIIATLDSPISATSGVAYWIAFNSNANLVGYNIEPSVRKWKLSTYTSLPNPAGIGYSDDIGACNVASGWGTIEVVPPAPPNPDCSTCPTCPSSTTLLIKVFVNSSEKTSWTQTVGVGETVNLTYTITNMGQ